MEIINISAADAEMLEMFRATEREVAAEGMFCVESDLVTTRAMEAGCEPVAHLCIRVPEHFDSPAPVYVAEDAYLRSVLGHTLTRGMMSLFRLPAMTPMMDMCSGASRVIVLWNVVDAVNVGTIVRSACALGFDGVLLSRSSCSPLNRRASRASMGNVFNMPWAWIEDLDELKAEGFKTVAMALTDDSVSLEDEVLRSEKRLAVIMGNEGDGLPESVIDACDYTVCIPMRPGVDSLNVSAAAAIAMWSLRV